MQNLIINIDGGSRGNPGPSAIGVVFSDEDGRIIKKYFQYLGEGTNNEAEYQALIFALKKAKSLFGKEKAVKMEIEIKSDSELLVKQMNGEYKIKNPNIQKLFLEAWNLKVEFKNLKFSLVPREKNSIADNLVNQALNKEAAQKKLFY